MKRGWRVGPGPREEMRARGPEGRECLEKRRLDTRFCWVFRYEKRLGCNKGDTNTVVERELCMSNGSRIKLGDYE